MKFEEMIPVVSRQRVVAALKAVGLEQHQPATGGD